MSVINEALKKTDTQVLSIDQKRILAIMENKSDLAKKSEMNYKPNLTETAIESKPITIGDTAIVPISHFKTLPCQFIGAVSLGFQTKSDQQSISNVLFETDNFGIARGSKIYMNTIQAVVFSVINIGTKTVLMEEHKLKNQLQHGQRTNIDGYILILFQGHSPLTYKVNQCSYDLTDDLQYKLVYSTLNDGIFSINSPEFTIIYNQFDNTYSLKEVYLRYGNPRDFELYNKPMEEPMGKSIDSRSIF